MRWSIATLLMLALAFSAPFSAAAAGANSGNASSLAVTRAVNVAARFVLSPASPNVILPNQQITITFFYNTTAATGAIVTGRPFNGTTPTAGATMCQTAVLPLGSGTGTCTISLSNAGVKVTSIRFKMWDSTQTTVLFNASLPVSYAVRSATNLVSGFDLTPSAPNVMPVSIGVNVHFSYQTDQAAGVRVVVVPYSGSNPTPNALLCPAAILPVGSGTGTCRFSVGSAAKVTSLTIQMWDANHTTVLSKAVIPVAYRFVNQPSVATNITLTPVTANIARIGDKIALHFSYQTDQAAGIIVQADPFSGTTLMAGSTSTASAVLPTGTGKGLCTFSVSSGALPVTKVRVQVWDATHATLLFQTFLPVNYQLR